MLAFLVPTENLAYGKENHYSSFFVFIDSLRIYCLQSLQMRNCTGKIFRVENIVVWPYANNNMITDPAVPVSADSISLRYEFSIGCVACQKNPFTELLNSAYACSCGDCGYEGTKSRIRTLEITSDSVYNGIPANSSLNNVFKIKRWYYFTPSEGKTPDTVKTYINNRYPISSPITLFSTTKPLDAKSHMFTLTLTTEDGNIRAVTTPRIFWH